MEKKIVYLKRIISSKVAMKKKKEELKTIVKDEDKILLYSLIGRAVAYKRAESVNGEYVIFRGIFEAKNKEGDIYQSKECVVYQPCQVELCDMLDSQEVREGIEGGIEFGLLIELMRMDSLACGYVTVITNLFESFPSDLLLNVRERAMDAIGERSVGSKPKPKSKSKEKEVKK